MTVLRADARTLPLADESVDRTHGPAAAESLRDQRQAARAGQGSLL